MSNNLTNGSIPNRTINDFPVEEEMQGTGWSCQDRGDNASEGVPRLEQISPDSVNPAIDVVTAARASAAYEELAHDLGYDNVRQMMEQTEIVPLPNGSFSYLTTDSDNYWVAWRDKPFYDIQRFDSRQEAISSLQECADWLVLER